MIVIRREILRPIDMQTAKPGKQGLPIAAFILHDIHQHDADLPPVQGSLMLGGDLDNSVMCDCLEFDTAHVGHSDILPQAHTKAYVTGILAHFCAADRLLSGVHYI